MMSEGLGAKYALECRFEPTGPTELSTPAIAETA